MPKKVDVSLLEDYKSLNQIDNEGKNLFDFVTCSVWDVRNELEKQIGTLLPWCKKI